MKTALITGISGQDGAYLANFLLKKKYKIIGLDRRSSRDDRWRLDFFNISQKIIFEYSDLTETTSLERIFKKYPINEVYNLGAQSFVGSSFDTPITTSNVNALGCLRMLEVIRNQKRKIKFYQASTSEMFGDVKVSRQNEKTPFNPQSPYAISKLFAYHITKNYRESYGIFTTNGILFNHESPLRGEEFVTRKITIGLAKILSGKSNIIILGNLYSKRDWGFAGDYVEAMWKMMQAKIPEDYVVATGQTFSVKDFINIASNYCGFKILWRGKGVNEVGISSKTKKIIIRVDKKNFRPAEVNYLKGDYSKIKKKLKWKPKMKFKQLVKIMMEEEIKKFVKFM